MINTIMIFMILKKNSNIIALLSVLLGVGILALGSVQLRLKFESMAPPVKEVEMQYAADFSNDAVLVGASHNIFTAKVLQQIGTKDLGDGPETQFLVEIIEN